MIKLLCDTGRDGGAVSIIGNASLLLQKIRLNVIISSTV